MRKEGGMQIRRGSGIHEMNHFRRLTLPLGSHKPLRQMALDALKSLGGYLTNCPNKDLSFYDSKTANSNHARYFQPAFSKVGTFFLDNLIESWNMVPKPR